MKKVGIAVILLFVFQTIGAGASYDMIKNNIFFEKNEITNDGTDYWALLVGVTEIPHAPWMDIPYNKIVIENLRDMLLVSEFWQRDHIKTLVSQEATYRNIIDGFRWLDENADENDICLFYITTHGSYFPIDLPPFDETDGDGDEVLYTWTSGIGLFNIFNRFPQFPPGIPFFGSLPYIHDISDDQLKNLLNKLDAKGVCAIIETCYSGGFNDYTSSAVNNCQLINKHARKTQQQWSESFAEELSSPGKVILMSCKDTELSQGSCFTYFAIEGFQGNADENHDGLCSAEEIFNYASPLTESWLKEYKNWDQHPQMYDDYSGDLIVTESEEPPLNPIQLEETSVGTVKTEQHFMLQCTDPQQDNIRLFIDWDDGSSEFTDFFASNGTIDIGHIWETEGAYNIWVFAEDEHGAKQYNFGLPTCCFPIAIADDETSLVDQYQMMIYQPEGFLDCDIGGRFWQAQSFIPQKPNLSQVALWTLSLTNTSSEITIHLRKNLTGEDLASATATVPSLDLSEKIPFGWTAFDIPDVTVAPNEIYYLICSQQDDTNTSMWFYADPDYIDSEEDPYTDGQAFISKNGGRSWMPHRYANDFCFVTYGKNVE